MVGFNIAYGGTKRATVSVWKASYSREDGEDAEALGAEQVVKNVVSRLCLPAESALIYKLLTCVPLQPFRVSDGSTIPSGSSLVISALDFDTDVASLPYQDAWKIVIPYTQLAQFLRLAE